MESTGRGGGTEGELVALDLREEVLSVVVLQAKICLQQAHRLFVDVVVRVVLERFDLLQTISLVDVLREDIRGFIRAIRLANLEDVFQTFERNGDDARIAAVDEIAQGLDTSATDEIFDLLVRSTTCGVRNRPSRLLLNVKFRVGEQFNERRNDFLINDALNLILVAGGDV